MRPCNQFKTSCHHLILTCYNPANTTFSMQIAVFTAKIIAFFLEMYFSTPDKRVPQAVTATVLNFSPFAHEISSVEAPKGGKFTEVQYMDISFLQLPSHIEEGNVISLDKQSTWKATKRRREGQLISKFYGNINLNYTNRL